MPALTQKQLRNAAPVDTLPYAVERKYEDPKFYGTISQVRALLGKDVADLKEFANRCGTRRDLHVLAGLLVQLSALSDETLPLNVSLVIDEHTQTKYQVKVWDRRKG